MASDRENPGNPVSQRNRFLHRTRTMDILIIEDDPAIGKAVQQGLSEANHACTWVREGPLGLEHAATQRYEAIILDLLLPGEHGLNVLAKLRDRGIKTPVIVVTALGALGDKLEGLGRGADDYLVKPFEMAELLARFDAVCRRATLKPAAHLRVGELHLDLATRKVTCGDVGIDLTPTEFSILEMLMRHDGQ